MALGTNAMDKEVHMQPVPDRSRWLLTDHRIRRWRSQREVLIYELETGVILSQANHRRLNPLGRSRYAGMCYRELNLLCQQIIDYLSAGHFDMYRLLLQEGSQLNGRARCLIGSIYRRIGLSTDTAIDFNDKYDTDAASVLEEGSLSDDIARLGLAMKERFELEDQLISLLHDSRSEAYAS